MKKLLAIVVVSAAGLVPPPALADRYPQPAYCGAGEPAYTGWNYVDLRAYGVKCSNAHQAAEEYVYDFSTEGVIEPPDNWRWCKDKPVGGGVFKGRCARVRDDRRQKITFLFSGPDQPWFH